MKTFLRLAGFALICSVIAPASAQYALQFGAAVAVSGDEIIVGEGRNLLLPGTVVVYNVAKDGTWSQSQVLTPPGADGQETGFGRALAATDDALIIGASVSRAAYFYERGEQGQWQLVGDVDSVVEGFGANVAIEGRLALIAQTGSRESAGGVTAYRKTGGSWVPAAELIVTDSLGARAGFGQMLAINGGTAVVGAPGYGGRTGAAYSFAFDEASATWTTGVKIEFPFSAEASQFGSSAVLSDRHLFVGAPGFERGMGSVAVFDVDPQTQTWRFVSRLFPFDASGGESFGSSLALAGEELWVGAPGYGAREGIVYSYQMVEGSARMTSSTPMMLSGVQYRSGFGTALAAGRNLAVVGANGHDNFEGAAFPYVPKEGGWSPGNVLYNDSGKFASVTGGKVTCADGEAGDFKCSDVDMLSFLSREDIGAARGIQVNDVWGWEDPLTGSEYAIVGRTDGTSFIDVTNASNPVYLGNLPKTEGSNQSIWRDMKVYKDHAFIVADGAGAHHMQIFDLKQLRSVPNKPATFTETAIYDGVYSSHNIIINEETGYAYAVGSDSGGETCGGALHMINIQDPVNPKFAGCFTETRTGRGGSGATHDAQCVTYDGPDRDFLGREICLSSNGTALSIADVTDKDNPVAISVASYPSVAYAHQGWLTEDHRYFYLNDEGDEVTNVTEATRTIIFDLAELDDPVFAGEYLADHNSIDHNLYIKGNLMYQANYSAGLRIIDISDPENPKEVGHFDTVPYGKNDNSPVLGAWSNYPYFKSGIIVVTSGREGLFILKKKDVDI